MTEKVNINVQVLEQAQTLESNTANEEDTKTAGAYFA